MEFFQKKSFRQKTQSGRAAAERKWKMAEEFKRLKRELVYKGAIVDFYKDTIQVPNGNIVK